MKALLLDLDDTLLRTNLEEFLPAYMSRLAGQFSDYGPPDEIIAKLTRATRAMIADLDPTRTLKETFDAHFWPSLGVAEAELRASVERFYTETYPELRSLTEPVPGARDLVAAAEESGFEIAIATNPLLPEQAMLQRLEWAGLDGFQLVSSYEKFHFAKPQPEYYAEILALLGATPDEAAMIGDHAENDVIPARLLGLSVYHRSPQPAPDTPGGDLVEAKSWVLDLADGDSEQTPTQRRPRAVLARLRGHLAALLYYAGDGIGPAWSERPSAREWAPIELICYLRDREQEILQPALRNLLAKEVPFLPAADSQGWAELRGYLQQDPRDALEAFVAARQETIRQLSALRDEGWSRRGRHALHGPVTLASWLDLAADDELQRLAQLGQFVGAA